MEGKSAAGTQRGFNHVKVTGALILCMWCIHLLWTVWSRSPAEPTPPSASLTPPASPSEAALREAAHHWLQAQDAVEGERSRLREWDAETAESTFHPFWKQEQFARTPAMEQALVAAARALILSQTREERCRALRWLAQIECALGRHKEELQRAQQLVALEPREKRSLVCLLRAAKCNHLRMLEQQASTALKTLGPP
jgi:hypothetical protein